MMQPAFAAVDWGTTNFRLWLISASGSVLASSRSDQGAAGLTRPTFAQVLEQQLAAVSAPDDLPVLICGMAGSRFGWQEARYLETPTPLSALETSAIAVVDAARDIRILPGIAHRDATMPDVMRGEETQLAGALAQGIGDGLYCLPGTHSKWISVKNQTVVAFRTFMTGEFFSLLSRQSILRETLSPTHTRASDDPAFASSVRKATASPDQVPGWFFGIRAGHLLALDDPGTSSARLSGYLVGSELAAMAEHCHDNDPILLVADGDIADAYAAAIKVWRHAPRRLSAEDMTCAGMHALAMRIWF